MDTAKYRDLFISEAEEEIAKLSAVLLAIEKAPGTGDQYALAMRSAHTIKGAAATMGYQNTAELAHALEDLFHASERNAISFTSTTVSLSLEALDALSESLRAIKERDEDASRNEIVKRLREALSTPSVAPTASPALPLAADRASEDKARPPSREPAAPSGIPETIKVSIDRLDALMGLFEELLMLRLKLDSLVEPAKEMLKTIENPLVKQRLFFINEFKSLFTDMGRLLSETQDELLRIRLVPLEQLFGQFPRMMRDAALQSGKKAEFFAEGGDVELDRTVVGGLGGALTHLLRNAIAHGIELEGTVRLKAERAKDRVRITVEDDGTGILYDKVRAVAIERGVLAKDVAERATHNDLNELLFYPEMSTEARVSMLSGRGVGLFAVKTFAQEVGGTVGIVSPTKEGGGGTRFTLDLPISVATARVLLVQSRRFIFALPFRNIERTFSFRFKDIEHLAHQREVVFEGHSLPLLSLEEIFGVPMRKEPEPDKELTAVLVTDDRARAGLLVERIIGERELLVKALPPVLRDLESFSGSALLPDGRTVLLLDAGGLLTHALNGILKTAEQDRTAAHRV